MKILIVDDEDLGVELVASLLSREFPGVTIDTIRTECAFRSAVPELRANPPNIVVLDMLLRWSDLGDELPPESEGGFYRAGARCQQLLASYPETKNVPVIFHSVLDRSEAIPDSRLPGNALFCSKRGDPVDFLRKVRSLLAAQQKLMTTPTSKNQVFISYSHKDKKFLEELLVHLKPLERAGRVTTWSDKQIDPGDKWFGEIKQALASSKMVVMLLTSNFLASDFIHEHELGPVLKEAEVGGVKILWIMVRACSYQETALKDYQAVLPLDKPLAEMKAERDTAWVNICKAIKKAAE